MTISTLFLQNVTAIDFAIITDYGDIEGGSYNASFEVSGKVEEFEQVVIDFGTVKKAIKKIVDDNNNGFDHKLWFVDDFSKISRVEYLLDEGNMIIELPWQRLELPRNAVKIIPVKNGHYSLYEDIIAQQVQEKLQEDYPNAQISVKCELDCYPLIPTNCTSWKFFRYTHGLKNSSSWGCQNIAHGHLSFIGVHHPFGRDVFLDKIINDIDGVNFIWGDNVLDSDKFFTTSTYSSDRGTFLHCFKKDKVKHIILPTETTIENIIEFVKLNYGKELKKRGADRLFLSEGLIKGACVYL